MGLKAFVQGLVSGFQHIDHGSLATVRLCAECRARLGIDPHDEDCSQSARYEALSAPSKKAAAPQ